MVTAAIFRSLIVVALTVSKHGSTECFRHGQNGGFYRKRMCCHSRSFLYPRNHDENHHPKNPAQQRQQQQQQLDAHHQKQFPIPAMPSDNFRKMAESQLELLANSLTSLDNPSETKVQSMILYLPQENLYSGQLEFTPAVLYPDPSTERVFIASDAASGQAPTLPKSLSKLPGFSSAPELLPGYPMLPSAPDPGVGVVEEVMCDIRFKTAALSVPLLSGSQTVGVLLVSPTISLTDEATNSEESSRSNSNKRKTTWTKRDKQQVSLAAQSLSMALNMDNERSFLSEQNEVFRENLSDSLHQMKNPIQALRTYGKILQRQIVETSISNNSGSSDENNGVGGTAQLLELAERLMVQSDRVVDMLGPMDSLVETLATLPPSNDLAVMLPPAVSSNSDETLRRQQQQTEQSMVLWNSRSAPEDQPTEPQNDGHAWSNQTIVPEVSGNLQASKFFNTTVDETDFQPSTTPASSSSSSSNYNPQTSTDGGTASLPATVIGDFETEMVYITDVLKPVFDTFEVIASEQGISFEVVIDEIDDLPGVFVAPKSLREAVSNVLDNALKYAIVSRPGSPLEKNPSPRVRVRIFPNDDCCNSIDSGSAQTQTPGVTVLVEDNGPGVAEDDREQIFRRGFRSDRTASEVEGRGIGLDISRALLARMGGCLGLVSQDDYKEWGLTNYGLGGAAMKLEVTRKLYRLAER